MNVPHALTAAQLEALQEAHRGVLSLWRARSRLRECELLIALELLEPRAGAFALTVRGEQYLARFGQDVPPGAARSERLPPGAIP